MKVLVVGCGKVGSNLAVQLCLEGHSVTLLDTRLQQMQDVINSFDVKGIIGDGTSHASLEEAGIADVDLLCAITGSDEKNLLCCLIARQMSNCRLVARVRNPIYSRESSIFRKSFDLAMIINPELAAASEISRVFRFPSAINISTCAKGRVELLKFRVPADSVLCGMKLADIRSRFRCDVLICVAERGSEVMIPSGDFEIRAEDRLSLIASPKDAGTFFSRIGINNNPVDSVLIVGGGTITYYLARQLINTGMKVRIIEVDEKRCHFLAEELPEAEVIMGDGTDEHLLLEEGIGRVKGFAALTGIDEENILVSLYAESVTDGDAKIVTKVNRITFNDVISKMSLGTIVNPKTLTAEYLLQYIRSVDESESSVENLYLLANGRVEALEFYIKEKSAVTDRPLQALDIREGVLIGKINRSSQLITPTGNTELRVGDSVVVIARTEEKLSSINDILKKRADR